MQLGEKEADVLASIDAQQRKDIIFNRFKTCFWKCDKICY